MIARFPVAIEKLADTGCRLLDPLSLGVQYFTEYRDYLLLCMPDRP